MLPSSPVCGDLGNSAEGKERARLVMPRRWWTVCRHTHTHTYRSAVVIPQETELDLTVQVDGGVVGEGEHPEGETRGAGDAVLNHLYGSI